MKRQIQILAVGLMAISLFQACKKKVKPGNEIVNTDTVASITNGSDAAAVKALVSTNPLDFNTFSGKVRVDISGVKSNYPQLTANLKMKKDEYIWISLQASLLNLEVARLYVTKDSVVLIDKLKREVTIRDANFLEKLTKLPLTLVSMQELLAGKPVFYDETKSEISKNGDSILMKSSFRNYQTAFVFLANGFLQQLKMSEAGTNRNAQIVYGEFRNVDGKNFSVARDISIQDADNMKILLRFDEAQFNKDLSVSFSIPDNYSKN